MVQARTTGRARAVTVVQLRATPVQVQAITVRLQAIAARNQTMAADRIDCQHRATTVDLSAALCLRTAADRTDAQLRPTAAVADRWAVEAGRRRTVGAAVGVRAVSVAVVDTRQLLAVAEATAVVMEVAEAITDTGKLQI